MAVFKKILNKNFKIVFILTVLMVMVLYFFGVFSPLENKVYDSLFVLENLIYPKEISDIIIVAIDDKTLNNLEGWPLSRSYYARTIELLEEAGAKAIGVDVIFAEHSSGGEDNSFANVLKSYNNIVIPVIAELEVVRKLHGEIVNTKKFNKPVDIFADNAGLGHINYIPDRDGVIRNMPCELNSGDEKYSPFSSALVGNIDFSCKNNYLINFPGPPGTVPRVSLIDVLQKEYNPGFFAGKYVLLGSTAIGVGDRYMTSFSRYGYLSGIELLAQNLYNIINSSYIKKISFFWNLLILLIISGFIYLLFKNYSPLKVFVVLIFVDIIYLAAAIYLFYSKNILLYFVSPVIATFIIYGTGLIYHHYFSEKQNKDMIKSFSRYLSPRVINRLIKDPEKIKLGGENVCVSVMFVDIRNFTDFAENKSPEEITEILNKYYSTAVNILFKYDGTLDKYLGDGLLSFFGAPLSIDNHRDKAFLAAREIQECTEKGSFPFTIGIGINSGQVIAGNVGSEERMNYTIVGDTVNKAAKYVDIARSGEIIAGESTYKGLSSEYKKIKWEKEDYINSEIYRFSLNNLSSGKEGI